MTHICVAYLTIITSDNGLSPSQRQAIIWTNAGILLIRLLGTNFSEILIEIHTSSFKKMHLKDVVCKKAAILSRPKCVDKGRTQCYPCLQTCPISSLCHSNIMTDLDFPGIGIPIRVPRDHLISLQELRDDMLIIRWALLGFFGGFFTEKFFFANNSETPL